MRRLLLFLVVLTCAPTLRQPLRGQSPSVQKEASSNRKEDAALSQSQPQTDQRGTKDAPLIVDMLSHPKSQEESAKDKTDDQHKAFFDGWTVGSAVAVAVFTGVLMIIGWRGVNAANRTLREIKRQADLMDTQIQDSRKSNKDSAKDVQASIAEAVRSAKAMEGVAESMSVNAASVKESVRISREIADMQKLATTLQSRAYLSAGLNAAKFQDANHVFEVQALLRNHGNTPAYDVTFRSVVQIIDTPIPEDFTFPLPDETAGTSVSLMAPGTIKLITHSVAAKVPEDQVEGIKRGKPPRALAMWGSVKYRDAFAETRHLKFAFIVFWIPWVLGMDKDKDGKPLPEQVMSVDTARHNDAN
jgi:hypothetical protein